MCEVTTDIHHGYDSLSLIYITSESTIYGEFHTILWSKINTKFQLQVSPVQISNSVSIHIAPSLIWGDICGIWGKLLHVCSVSQSEVIPEASPRCSVSQSEVIPVASPRCSVSHLIDSGSFSTLLQLSSEDFPVASAANYSHYYVSHQSNICGLCGKFLFGVKRFHGQTECLHQLQTAETFSSSWDPPCTSKRTVGAMIVETPCLAGAS